MAILPGGWLCEGRARRETSEFRTLSEYRWVGAGTMPAGARADRHDRPNYSGHPAYLLTWVRGLFSIRSIRSTDWDDTRGRLVQPLLRSDWVGESWRNRGRAEATAAGFSVPIAAALRRGCGRRRAEEWRACRP
jgi:hypothetical protein